jgi:hypothetical protein
LNLYGFESFRQLQLELVENLLLIFIQFGNARSQISFPSVVGKTISTLCKLAKNLRASAGEYSEPQRFRRCFSRNFSRGAKKRGKVEVAAAGRAIVT